VQVIGSQVYRAGEKGIQHSLSAPGHPAHFSAQILLDEVHA
jgi:hypothetical protein